MNDNYATPLWLMEHFKNHFDPCPLNADFDGLKIEWKSPTFVNPPYSDPLAWVIKAIEQSKKGVSVVMLLRIDVSTKFYKLIMEQNPHIAFFNERLHFNELKQSPNFSSMLVYLEVKKE